VKATRSLRRELEKAAEESVSGVLVLNHGQGRVVLTMGTPTQAFFVDGETTLVNEEALAAFGEHLDRPIRVAWAKWDLEEARGPELDESVTIATLAEILVGAGTEPRGALPLFSAWDEDAPDAPEGQEATEATEEEMEALLRHPAVRERLEDFERRLQAGELGPTVSHAEIRELVEEATEALSPSLLPPLLPPIPGEALAEGSPERVDVGALALTGDSLLVVGSGEQEMGFALLEGGVCRDAVWITSSRRTTGADAWQALCGFTQGTLSVYSTPETWLRSTRQLWRFPVLGCVPANWVDLMQMEYSLSGAGMGGHGLRAVVVQAPAGIAIALATPDGLSLSYSTTGSGPSEGTGALASVLGDGAWAWLLGDVEAPGVLMAPASFLHRGVPAPPPVVVPDLGPDDFGVGAWFDEEAAREAAAVAGPPPPPPDLRPLAPPPPPPASPVPAAEPVAAVALTRNSLFPFTGRVASAAQGGAAQGSLHGWQGLDDDFLHTDQEGEVAAPPVEEEVVFEGADFVVPALDLDWDLLLGRLAGMAHKYLGDDAQPVTELLDASPRTSSGVRETIKAIGHLQIEGFNDASRKAMVRQMSFVAAEYSGG
jgi:hypothetical protein